jgi:Cu/Ag efflux protein CusF
MILKRAYAAALFLSVLSAVSAAQTVTRPGETKKITATIQQIDSTSRVLTFKNEDGTEDAVYAGPEVTRFDELKVGDKVNMTYYESTVFTIRKPGDPPLSAGTSGTEITRGSGPLPGATSAKQSISTVTVKSVDPAAGVITVTTAGGRVVTRKVDDKSNLANVKVGDQIDIVSTQALLVNVERPQ